MKIVVGYIHTPEGQAAVDHAVAEARLRDATLVVVHSMRGGKRDELEQTMAYREEFQRLEERLTGEGIDFELRELVRGNTPTEDLIEIAREGEADLIVIGLRRRSRVGKAVLGSNAQDLLLASSCPILAVKAPRDEGA
jgi:nucleotide-binding universal stress UspA family protein